MEITIENRIEEFVKLAESNIHTEYLEKILTSIKGGGKVLGHIKLYGLHHYLENIYKQLCEKLINFNISDLRIDNIGCYVRYKDLQNTLKFFLRIDVIVFMKQLKKLEDEQRGSN